MKKMSLLTALIAAVAISAYSVSGTYAKYTSKIDFTDDARVAKWSFTTTNTNTDENGVHKLDLFANSYKFDGKSKVWVQSVDKTNVVAPGTSGKASFTLNGSMETAFTIDYLMEAENDFVVYYQVTDGKITDMRTAAQMPKKTVDGKEVVDSTGYKEYRPLKYTITHTRNGEAVDAINSVLQDKNAAELAAAFKTYNDNNAQMSDGHIFTPGTYTLSFDIDWKWNTHNTITGDDANHTLVNTLDTFAGENLNNTRVNFNISAVANQVADDYSK